MRHILLKEDRTCAELREVPVPMSVSDRRCRMAQERGEPDASAYDSVTTGQWTYQRCSPGDLMPTREHCFFSALPKSHGRWGTQATGVARKRFDVVGASLACGVTVALSLVSFGQPAQGGRQQGDRKGTLRERHASLRDSRSMTRRYLSTQSAYLAKPNPAFYSTSASAIEARPEPRGAQFLRNT